MLNIICGTINKYFRTIGFAASILYDRCNIRDGLINGLDSRNEKEVDAAICASRAFASRSRHVYSVNLILFTFY